MKYFSFFTVLLLAPASAFAGSQTFSTPGNYTFTVPAYESLTVRVSGAGGGGGASGAGLTGGGEIINSGGTSGSGGEGSRFGSVRGYGGGGGGVGGNGGCGIEQCINGQPGPAGDPGNATGGDVNTPGGGAAGGGGQGSPGWNYGDNGGDGPFGWASGGPGGSGGAGGLAIKTYTSGSLAAGSTVSVEVGLGGDNSPFQSFPSAPPGQAGENGSVVITWGDSPPACSIAVSPNPITLGDSSVVSWSSENATSFHITSISYVSPNVPGSASVTPSSSRTYQGTVVGPGGTRTCTSETLVVSDPPPPSCSITTSPSSVRQGQSSTITWDSSNATSFYINGVSYVQRSGWSVITAMRPTTYTGFVQGPGGTANCEASIAVRCENGESVPSSGICETPPVLCPDGSPIPPGGICPITRYACSTGNRCVESASGPYTSSSCNNVCPPTRYACSTGNRCVQSANGPYTSSSCNNVCPPTRYACNSSYQCLVSGNGPFTSSSCAGVCGVGYCPNGTPVPANGICACPTGSTWSPTTNACVTNPCLNGYTYNPVTNRCEITSCPSGYSLEGGECVITSGCTPHFFCQNGNLYHENAACTRTLSQVCTAGCAGGACTVVSSPTLSLSALPTLIRSGDRATIRWNATHVTSCTLVGSNDESIPPGCSGFTCASSAAGHESTPIIQRTTYTLECTARRDGATVSASSTIMIVPGWQER